MRWATWAGATVLVVLIGLSRTYVGVHYPTDVLAGWLAGVAWTGLLVAVFRLLGAFTGEVPEPVPPAAQSRSANSLEE
ncbi:MAG: phosphatase PAP2 family protein [Candidatus Longimicrobiales bacterium M2_2A_002]